MLRFKSSNLTDLKRLKLNWRNIKSTWRKRWFKSIWRKRWGSISVIINQARILKLAKSRKKILLKPILLDGGSIEHYYHFIVDLMLPLYCLVKKALPNYIFMVDDFGLFTENMLQIFPEYVQISDLANDNKNVQEVKLIGMNPRCVFLTEKTLESFRKDTCSRLGVDLSGQANKILLIQRLPPDEYFVSKAKIKGSGTSRRSIINHAELLSALMSIVQAPFKLHNLQLERMSLKDQAYFFDRAIVVIAQHGAGLVNCIWMRRQAIVIELNESERFNHFHTLSKLRQLHYFRYNINAKHATINIEDFTRWLSGIDMLRQYFSSTINQ